MKSIGLEVRWEDGVKVGGGALETKKQTVGKGPTVKD